MNRSEFEAAKQKGELLGDADLTEKEIFADDQLEEEIVDEDLGEDIEDEIEEDIEHKEEIDELPELTEKEKTAFQKRLERDMKKFEEKKLKELEDQVELKYSKHKLAIDQLGGDPDRILEAAKDNALKLEAQRLADQHGWDENDTQYYIEQKKMKSEMQELRVQSQINRLEKDPNYTGIANMEKAILAKIEQTGGQLSVEDAFWVLGGSRKVEQIKLEATLREAEKRKKTPRTIISDAEVTHKAEKPLPSDVLRDMESMGISAEEARRLMNTETPKNIAEYRKNKSQKK